MTWVGGMVASSNIMYMYAYYWGYVHLRPFVWNSADNIHLMLGAQCQAYMSSWISTQTSVVAIDVSGRYSGEQISWMAILRVYQCSSLFWGKVQTIRTWRWVHNLRPICPLESPPRLVLWQLTWVGSIVASSNISHGNYYGYVHIHNLFVE